MKISDFRKFTSKALPITELVKVSISGSQMIVEANNLHVYVSHTTKAPVLKNNLNAVFCIRPEDLEKVLSMHPDTITIEMPDRFQELGTITSRNKKASVKCAIESAEDFPVPSMSNMRSGVDIESLPLTSAAVFTSDDAIQEAMMYISLSKSNVVATDGKLMYIESCESEIEEEILVDPNIVSILPYSFSVRENDKFIVFTDETTTIAQVKSTYTFPRWRNAIPEGGETFSVDVKALTEAVKFCLFASNTVTNRVAVEVRDSVLTVTSDDIERAKEATYSFDVECDMKDIKFLCNGTWLLKILGAIRTDTAEIRFTSSSKPIMFRSGAKEFLLSPMMF